MKIEIIKGTETPVTEFFSSPSDTPETDSELHGIKAVCKDEYMLDQMAEFSRKLERERDEWRKAAFEITEQATKSRKELEREFSKAMQDSAQLADRLSGLELRTTEELAKMEQERNASRELAIAFHNDQTNLILLLQEWKDMAAKLVNIASYALGEFDVKLTLDQQRNITETMREYHSLLKKQ